MQDRKPRVDQYFLVCSDATGNKKRLRNAEPLNCRLMSKGGRGGGRHQTSQTIQMQCDASVN